MSKKDYVDFNTPFGGDDWELRVTPWAKLDVGAEIREYRPRLHRPLDCKLYRPVYRPEFYKFEGACYNFKWDDIRCVFCNAQPMSNAFMKIPFDIRFNCDKIMGW